jgi:hypothetical protein
MSDSTESADLRECKRCKTVCELTVRSSGRSRANDCKVCHSMNMKHMRILHKMVGPPVPSCEICQRLGRTQLDHVHATAEFRGWLCRECNVGLGKLGDDIAGIRRALAYMERSLARSLASSSGLDAEERARSRSPRRDGDSRGAAAAPESL